jgi:3-methyladenine DNA glycosylase/8-oxoguanine DNA glycosylase
LEGEVPIDKFPEMEDGDIVTSLRKVKGLERWTAEMFLIHAMARPDVFPATDQPLQKILQEFCGIDKRPKTVHDANPLTAPWRPWRTLAAWYLWRIYNERQEAKAKARECRLGEQGEARPAGKADKLARRKAAEERRQRESSRLKAMAWKADG